MAIGAKPDRRLAVRGAHDDEQEHHGQHDLGEQAGEQAVLARRVLAVAVGGEALGEIEAGRAAGDGIEDRRGDDGADDLRDDVGHDVLASGSARPPQRPTVTAGLRWQPEMWPMA